MNAPLLRLCLCIPAVWPVLAGCRRDPPQAQGALQVVRVSPSPAPDGAPGRLFLNQELTIYFNQPIDPLSVTTETVQVLDEAGHPVRGRLRVGSHSVTFQPEPPLDPSLSDGSFQPDREYRLVIAGYPRYSNAVQSTGGRILPRSLTLRYRTVAARTGLPGFPSPLLPVGTGTEPFLLRNTPEPQRVLAADPRLRLHFTLPVLPTSLDPEAFEILLLRGNDWVQVQPRALRLLSLPPPVDEYPGCTVEIDLGTAVQIQGEEEPYQLVPGDLVFVRLRPGGKALVDYRGSPVQMPPDGAAQAFEFVHGDRLAVAEWPAGEQVYLGDEVVLPGFEVLRDGVIRPRVRVEAGTGELGLFRPESDVVLDPARPFRLPDGREMAIRDGVFPFLAVDIPRGVQVRVVGGTARILSCGSIRIQGSLHLPGGGGGTLFRTGERVPPDTLLGGCAYALIAGGDIRVTGAVVLDGPPAEGASPVTLLAGGRIELGGNIPPRAVLAVEPGARRTFGPAPQPVTVVCPLTPGVPAGTHLVAAGWTDWQQPGGEAGATLQVRLLGQREVHVAYQTAAPDPVRPDRPDLRPTALPPPRRVEDGAVFQLPPQGFLRFRLEAVVGAGSELPQLEGIRIVDG